jgi:hypothetical protein
MAIGRLIEVQVEDARQPILLEISFTFPWIQPHMDGFEDGPHAVVVRVLDGIVLVVVALHALHRQSKKGARGVLDSLIQPRRAIEEIIAARQETGRPQIVAVLRREFVRRQHLADHLVVALVGIERFHDPIAPVPDVFLAVAQLRTEAVPVAVSPDVHEVTSPALPVLRRGEQTVHHARPRGVRRVLEKCRDLRSRRRQTDEIEVNSPQPDFRRSFGLRLQIL